MKNNSRVVSPCLFAAVFFVLMGLPAQLQSQAKMVLAGKLAERAEVIAIGKVTRVQSEWNESHTMIRTRVTLAVDQYVKGESAQGSLTLYVPGGEVDGVGEIYSHMPSFKEDESVVVFAEKDTEDRLRVSEGSRGKFTIEKDATSGKAQIAGGISLDQFETQLRLAVQKQQEMKR